MLSVASRLERWGTHPILFLMVLVPVFLGLSLCLLLRSVGTKHCLAHHSLGTPLFWVVLGSGFLKVANTGLVTSCCLSWGPAVKRNVHQWLPGWTEKEARPRWLHLLRVKRPVRPAGWVVGTREA